MTQTDLTFKGDIHVMSLRPGDIIIVTFHDRRMAAEHVEEIRGQVQERFPDHEILVVNRMDLSIQREPDMSEPDPETT